MRKPFKAMIYTLIAVIVACAYLIWTPDKDPVRLNEKYGQPPSAFVKIRGARVHFRDSGPQNAPARFFCMALDPTYIRGTLGQQRLNRITAWSVWTYPVLASAAKMMLKIFQNPMT